MNVKNIKDTAITTANTRALLVIDMQQAYFNNDALRERQDKLVSACNLLIAYAAAHDIPIFNVRTLHTQNGFTWTLNMHDDKQGYLFESSADSNNVEGLNLVGTHEIRKTRDSAFHNTDLASILHAKKIDELILCGVSTHTCVFMTAADAYAANFRVTLATDAIASHQPSQHSNSLQLLSEEYRQTLRTTEAIIS